MRVIAGRARRTTLAVGPETSARPFLELARGALFNALGSLVEDARVLDLYAGSGALGIEALSRGAAHCTFVEREKRSADLIRENLARCGLESSADIIRARVEDAAGQLRGPWGLIFVDPPFSAAAAWTEAEAAVAVDALVTRTLAPDGRLAFRLEEDTAQPPVWSGLALLRDRRYGRSRVCLYGRSAP